MTFTPDKFQQLVFSNPRLWWPAQMGKPNLYPLTMEFEVNGAVSDHSATEFGIREITSDLNSVGGRAFHINGKNILIRGGGWTPDMMMRENSQRLHDEFRYVRDMGLNTIRLEGKLETQEFFDLADHDGILVMAGWCCCDFWERWPRWQPKDFEIAKQSLRDQIYRLRSHPSLVMWLNGSDNPPPPDVEQMYLDVEKDLFWPNPVVSSATGKKTSVTGDSGVKMSGPYEYVAPSYWDDRHARRASPAASSAIPEAAAALTASTRKPAWDRPFRRSKAFAPWWAKTTCGRSTTSGTITRAAANSKPSACSPTRLPTATASPTT